MVLSTYSVNTAERVATDLTIVHIDPDIIIEDDDDTVLAEIAVRNSLSSSPSAMTDEDTQKPSAYRDLMALVKKPKPKPVLPHLGSRLRLESIVDVELGSKEKQDDALLVPPTTEGDSSMTTENDENHNPAGMIWPKTPRPRRERVFFKNRARRQAKKKFDEESYAPVVWVIEPGFNKNGTLRFKFTTDAGACLILNDTQALESIDIMKESSRAGTYYFQVFSIQGNSSRVVKPDQIAEAMSGIIADSKPIATEDDVLTSGVPPNKRFGHRFFRFLLRRRWKNLIRRQVRIAMRGGGNFEADSRRSRFVSMASRPFVMLWKRFTTRRNRASL